jgi:hypothetical protein
VDGGHATGLRSYDKLGAAQRALIEEADTFFIATAHPERGADASHRGGPPGVVEVAADGASLRVPDYSGNSMFQTLGNLEIDPHAGLLFLDWEGGTSLQLTGRARSVWGDEDRAVEFAIDAVRERELALPERWEPVDG